MNNPNSAGEKIRPHGMLDQPADILIWVIITLQILIALCAYPFLPARVPIHYGISGQATAYAPKWVASVLFPGINIMIWFIGVRQIAGPYLGGRTLQAANARWRSTLYVGVILFLFVLQSATTALNLGVNVDLIFLLNLSLSVLFIFMGNYLGKLRRNFWMGIRTPWTLASEEVWERTHRVGGWLFVACGLLCLPLSFVPLLRLWVIIPLLLLMAIFLFLYSYLCYQQQMEREPEPLARPFDGPDMD